jgi:hypothetical protein
MRHRVTKLTRGNTGVNSDDPQDNATCGIRFNDAWKEWKSAKAFKTERFIGFFDGVRDAADQEAVARLWVAHELRAQPSSMEAIAHQSGAVQTHARGARSSFTLRRREEDDIPKKDVINPG